MSQLGRVKSRTTYRVERGTPHTAYHIGRGTLRTALRVERGHPRTASQGEAQDWAKSDQNTKNIIKSPKVSMFKFMDLGFDFGFEWWPPT